MLGFGAAGQLPIGSAGADAVISGLLSATLAGLSPAIAGIVFFPSLPASAYYVPLDPGPPAQSALVSALDRALKAAGEDVVLRRIYGQAPRVNVVDVALRATVRNYKPEELVSGIAQTDSQVIMSPTEIAQAGWPGGELPSGSIADPGLPRRNDKIIVDGRARNIEFVNPISVNAVLVRIELRISG